MSIEQWKDIEGYEEIYQISNFGRVRSLGFHYRGGVKMQDIFKPGRVLANIKMDNGYLKAHLWNRTKGKLLSIHRLVAAAFIPNPFNKPQVNHKDCNKENNNVENLEWCDSSENQLHAIKNGRCKNRTGTKMPQFYIKVLQLCLSGHVIQSFDSIKDASETTGISAQHITMCAKGRLKRTRNCKWQYAPGFENGRKAKAAIAEPLFDQPKIEQGKLI